MKYASSFANDFSVMALAKIAQNLFFSFPFALLDSSKLEKKCRYFNVQLENIVQKNEPHSIHPKITHLGAGDCWSNHQVYLYSISRT